MKLPRKEETAMLSTRVSSDLLAEIKARKPRGVSLRDVLEFGLRAYLEALAADSEKQLDLFEDTL
jgi:hypothetical protein